MSVLPSEPVSSHGQPGRGSEAGERLRGLRILYCTGADLGAGGIGDIAFEAVAGIARLGNCVTVVAPRFHPRCRDLANVELRAALRPPARLGRVVPGGAIERLRSLAVEWAGAARLRRGEYQAAHFWSGWAQAGLQRARRLGIATVLDRASTHCAHQQEVMREEYRRFGIRGEPFPPNDVTRGCREQELADHVVTPSAVARESFLARGFAPDRVSVVPFGVDVERFRPGAAESGQVVYVGQVCLRKGVQYLLPAWERVAGAGRRLVFAGGVREDAAAAVRAGDGRPDVTFLRHVADAAALYRESAVFVLPSLEEGSALVTYEAMASGLGSVVTPATGSVGRDGRECTVVAPRDVDALAAALERLLANGEARRRQGEAGRLLMAGYPWSEYAARLRRVYGRLVAG